MVARATPRHPDQPAGRGRPGGQRAHLAVGRPGQLGSPLGHGLGAQRVGHRHRHPGPGDLEDGRRQPGRLLRPRHPYTAGDPARPSPDCGHTYRRSSAGQGGLRYLVSATTSWRISWVASGVVAGSGTLAPLERTATTSLRVAEAQTVN